MPEQYEISGEAGISPRRRSRAGRGELSRQIAAALSFRSKTGGVLLAAKLACGLFMWNWFSIEWIARIDMWGAELSF
jgi:hypothetical protein